MELVLVRSQVDDNCWVNRLMLDLVEQVPPERMREQFGGGFDTIHGTVSHILRADLHYYARWTGKPQNPWRDDATIAGMRAQWVAHLPDRNAFVLGLTPERLAAPLHYTTRDGSSYDLPLWQVMLQLVNHGTHHRAELADMLTRVGLAPPPTDLIVFYQEQAAQPQDR